LLGNFKLSHSVNNLNKMNLKKQALYMFHTQLHYYTPEIKFSYPLLSELMI